jgi:excisionase family DNA binding protein
LPGVEYANVAKRLGVCAATVYKLCATGALPHVRVLNSIRIEEAALRAFIVVQRRKRSRAGRRP